MTQSSRELSRLLSRTTYLHDIIIDEEVVQVLEVSSVLDQRFKVKFITEYRQAEAKAIILTQGIRPQSTRQVQKPVSSSAATPQGPQSAFKKRKTLGSFFKDKKQNQSGEQALSKTPVEQITTKLEKYLSIPMLHAEEEPLPWWKGYEKTFPVLARTASKYICTCACVLLAQLPSICVVPLVRS